MALEIKMVDKSQAQADSFYTDYLESVMALRSGLIEAFRTLGVDSSKPRETARELGLDKSLAWKITRIIHEEDTPRIAGNMPGTSGMKMVTKSLVDRELPVHIADSINDAYRSYLDMTKLHSSNKKSLELMLDGMSPKDHDSYLKSREYAYQGNCGIWGIQSSVRVSSHVLAINSDDPAQLDYAQFGGLTGFQRLRVGPPWPIFQFHSYEDSGKPMRSDMVPIGDNPHPDYPLIINEYCHGALPELDVLSDSKNTSYEFGDGPIGKTGNSDVFFGYIDTIPKPRYQDENNQVGELMCVIDTPIETLMFDLIVQRELAEQIDPQALVYGRATGTHFGHDIRKDRNLVPFNEPLRLLDPGAHMLTTPHAPSYAKLASKVFNKLNRSASDFVCWRLMMNYPIMPSTVSVKFSLPTQGDTDSAPSERT